MYNHHQTLTDLVHMLKLWFLSSITEQMMNSENSTIVYSNDGSGMSSVGNYVVQYVTINGT